MYIQITIDGPSGVGKSSLSKALSESLGFLSVNTGLIFRGLAWYFLKNNILNDQIPNALETLNSKGDFYFEENSWFLNKQLVSENELTGVTIAKKASQIASNPHIRKYVMEIEKKIATKHNIVIEGRDIGTQIFPNAILKIFLTADPKIRSQRRYQELKRKNLLEKNITIEDIYKEILDRDQQDKTRELSPLKIPKNAEIICSDHKSINDLVEDVKKLLQVKLQALQIH